MSHLHRPAVLLAALLAIARFPSTGLATEEAVWPAVFRDMTRVEVRNVDVWVTDEAGRPVTGLTREEFELFVDGEPVEISNFLAVEDGQLRHPPAAPAGDGEPATGPRSPAAAELSTPETQSFLLILVDNQNITPANRSRVLGRLRELLLGSWRPGLQVLVAANDRSLVVLQGLTAIPHEVFVALRELEGASALGSRLETEQRALLAEIEAINVEAGSGLFATKDPLAGPAPEDQERVGEDQARLTARATAGAQSLLPRIAAYGEERLQHVRGTLRVLGQLVDAAAGLPGRRAVLYVGDGLPLRPVEAIYEAYQRRFLALGDVGATLSPQSEAGRFDTTAELHDLVARAGSDQVSLHTLYTAAATSGRGSAASAGSSGGNFASWDDSFASTEERNRQEPLIVLAEGTGGQNALSGAAFETVLEGIVSDFDNYYSLGYSPDHLAEARDRRHSVEVTVRDERLQIRHRSSFRHRTDRERMAQKVLSALLLGGGDDALGISLETRQPTPAEDGHFVVPVLARVPLGRLVLLPDKAEHRAQVSVSMAARDAKGRTSPVVHHLCPIRIPNAEVLVASGRTMACGVQLLMREGPHELAVAVRDDLAGLGSTSTLVLDVGADAAPASAAQTAGPAAGKED